MTELILVKSIIYYLLLHGILGLLFKRGSNILGCGLAAYCGSVAPNHDKLNILGILNTSRGRDSCGVAIGDKAIKGINTDADFTNLAPSVDYKYKDNFNTLIHTRKSTHGSAHTKANAHPFLLGITSEKLAVTTTKPETVRMVGMHNGSIHNTYSLRNHFKLDENLDMDSKVLLGSILQHGNYKILSKYGGDAALIWYFTDDPNEIYVYKGAKDNKEERPLHYFQTRSKGKVTGIYISSQDFALNVIKDSNKTKIKSFKGNKVYRITEGRLKEIATVKREPLVIVRERVTKSSAEDWRDSRELDYTKYNNTNIGMGPSQTKLFSKTHRGSGESIASMINSGKLSVKADFVYNNSLICNKGQEIVPATEIYESESYVMNSPKDRVNYFYNRYWANGKLLEGKKFINEDGFIVNKKKESKSTIYFFRGILISDKENYEKCIKEKNNISIREISVFSPYPVINLPKEDGVWTNGLLDMHVALYNNKANFDEAFTPVFTNKKYIYNRGKLVSIVNNQYQEVKKEEGDSKSKRQSHTTKRLDLTESKGNSSGNMRSQAEGTLLEVDEVFGKYGKTKEESIDHFLGELTKEDYQKVLNELSVSLESLKSNVLEALSYFNGFEDDLDDDPFFVEGLRDLVVVSKILTRGCTTPEFEEIVKVLNI